MQAATQYNNNAAPSKMDLKPVLRNALEEINGCSSEADMIRVTYQVVAVLDGLPGLKTEGNVAKELEALGARSEGSAARRAKKLAALVTKLQGAKKLKEQQKILREILCLLGEEAGVKMPSKRRGFCGQSLACNAICVAGTATVVGVTLAALFMAGAMGDEMLTEEVVGEEDGAIDNEENVDTQEHSQEAAAQTTDKVIKTDDFRWGQPEHKLRYQGSWEEQPEYASKAAKDLIFKYYNGTYESIRGWQGEFKVDGVIYPKWTTEDHLSFMKDNYLSTHPALNEMNEGGDSFVQEQEKLNAFLEERFTHAIQDDIAWKDKGYAEWVMNEVVDSKSKDHGALLQRMVVTDDLLKDAGLSRAKIDASDIDVAKMSRKFRSVLTEEGIFAKNGEKVKISEDDIRYMFSDRFMESASRDVRSIRDTLKGYPFVPEDDADYDRYMTTWSEKVVKTIEDDYLNDDGYNGKSKLKTVKMVREILESQN